MQYLMETCKHSESRNEVGLCWACAANRKAAYDLTGTHDPEEQKKHWEDVWKVVENGLLVRFYVVSSRDEM